MYEEPSLTIDRTFRLFLEDNYGSFGYACGFLNLSTCYGEMELAEIEFYGAPGTRFLEDVLTSDTTATHNCFFVVWQPKLYDDVASVRFGISSGFVGTCGNRTECHDSCFLGKRCLAMDHHFVG